MYKAYKVRAILPATITVLNVQSHQDKAISNPKSPSLPAHLNMIAESRIYHAYKDSPHFHQPPLLPPLKQSWYPMGAKSHPRWLHWPLWHTTSQLCRTTSSINLIGMPSHLATLTEILQRESTNISPQVFLWHHSNSKMPVANKQIWHQCKQIPSPLCSCCTLYPETHNHVLCCEQAQQLKHYRSIVEYLRR